MAIHQTKKQSDLEKRLQILRRQVYGKGEKVNYQASKLSSYQASKLVSYSDHSIAQSLDSSIAKTSDITYLHHDLLKILIFSSFAIGAQVILFFLLKNNILKINLF